MFGALTLAAAWGMAWADQPLPRIGSVPPVSVQALGLDGKSVAPLGAEGPIVVFVVLSECPRANQIAPEIGRIIREYERKGIHSLIVYAEPSLAPAEAAKHKETYSLPGAACIDSKWEVCRALGATISPEAIVLDRNGAIAYRGRIDDRFPSIARPAAEPKSFDLRNALNDVIAGRKVRTPETEAVGCLLPWRF